MIDQTLGYGYTGTRTDPEVALVPADDPEPRNTSVPQAEGLQAEKVIKGLFTGNFNFAVNILAAANKTALTVTGSYSGGVALPTMLVTSTWTDTVAARAVLKLVSTGPGSGIGTGTTGGYLLQLQSGAVPTDKFLIAQTGHVYVGGALSNQVTLGFVADPTMGLGRITGTNRLQFFCGGFDCAEVELVSASVRRIAVAGTTNTAAQPYYAHQNNYTAGLWFSAPAGADNRVALCNQSGSILSVGQPTQVAAGVRNLINLGDGGGLAGAAGFSFYSVYVNSAMSRAGSGTHPLYAHLYLESPDDGASFAGIVTSAVNLYINGAPQQDGATAITNPASRIKNFWALRVAAQAASGGRVEFNGDFKVDGTPYPFVPGDNLAIIRFSAFTGVIAGDVSGTHPRKSLCEMSAFGTAGVAATTDATVLYLDGAPTVTGATNRALWVRAAGGGLVEFEGLVKLTQTITAAVGASVACTAVTGTITEAASGNHPRLSLIEVAALGVTAGAATVADATTVYIAGAPAAVVTGKNRALWVVGGEAEFGGIVTVGLDRGLRLVNQTNQAAAAVGTLNNAPVAGDPAVWVPVMVNGVNRALPAW